MLRRTKTRMAKTGGVFRIDKPEEIELPTHCCVFGTALVYGSYLHDPNGASIDKKRPELGYIDGNVRIISFSANRLKQNITDPLVFHALAVDAERLRVQELC